MICLSLLGQILQSLGPKYFLESALRQYSVLSLGIVAPELIIVSSLTKSAGERIVIEHKGVEHSLEISELKPAHVVSILGSVDLEVEFAIAETSQREGSSTCFSLFISLRAYVPPQQNLHHPSAWFVIRT